MVPGDELRDPSPRSTARRALPFIVGAVVVALLLGFGLRRSPSTGSAERAEGGEAPQFELPLLSGEGTLSSEELEGRPVVLNFWASYCYSCKEEAPVLDRAWRRHRDDGLVVLGVNVERDSPAAARRFAREFGMTYPLVRDEGRQLATALGINDAFLPQTFFIDRDWRFAEVFSGRVLGDASGTTVLGPVTADMLEAQVRKLL